MRLYQVQSLYQQTAFFLRKVSNERRPDPALPVIPDLNGRAHRMLGFLEYSRLTLLSGGHPGPDWPRPGDPWGSPRTGRLAHQAGRHLLWAVGRRLQGFWGGEGTNTGSAGIEWGPGCWQGGTELRPGSPGSPRREQELWVPVSWAPWRSGHGRPARVRCVGGPTRGCS